MASDHIYCSFCGKAQALVRKIVAGNNGYICNECILLTAAIVSLDDPAGFDTELAAQRVVMAEGLKDLPPA